MPCASNFSATSRTASAFGELNPSAETAARPIPAMTSESLPNMDSSCVMPVRPMIVRALLAERFPPVPELPQNLLAGALLAIDHPGAVAVLLEHVVLRKDELPVPGGIGEGGQAPAARRVGEADPVAPVEHKHVDVRVGDPVVEGVRIAVRRKALVERVAGVGSELELELVVDVAHGALVVVALRAELDPPLVVAEVQALVLGRVDVAGPEEADVAIPERVLVGLAAVGEIDVVGRDELEARPALQEERGRRRLVELRLAVRDLRERHRGVAGLEEGFRVPPQVLLAVEDVLVVEAGDAEKRGRTRPVGQLVDAVVAGPAAVVDLVVPDDRRQVADLERVVAHVRRFSILSSPSPSRPAASASATCTSTSGRR